MGASPTTLERATDATTWVVDWSDVEHRSFERAMAQLSPRPVVRRTTPVRLSVGEVPYLVRSRPRYARMATASLLRGPGPVVVWQPAAAMLAGSLPRRTSRLVGLNPLLRSERRGLRERVGRRGLAGLDEVVSFSSVSVDELVALGAPAGRTHHVPLGIDPRSRSARDGGYLLAAGRSQRDWQTLSEAARLVEAEVRVLGPSGLDELAGCTIAPDDGAGTYDALLGGATALVVPLVATSLHAGTQAVLNALARGVPVVATRNAGTVDYVRPSWGHLVEPGDVRALARAMAAVVEDETATAELAANAHAAVEREFSLDRFVREVEAIARS